MKRTREKSRVLIFFLVSSHIYFPSTITVDSINHTYTGTLSSSTYSGYKLAANSNKVVSAGDHTLSGYTGNNITLAISGNSVSVKNTKTATNRTTELQNFIRNNKTTKREAIAKNTSYGFSYTPMVSRFVISRTILLHIDTMTITNDKNNSWSYRIVTCSYDPILNRCYIRFSYGSGPTAATQYDNHDITMPSGYTIVA